MSQDVVETSRPVGDLGRMQNHRSRLLRDGPSHTVLPPSPAIGLTRAEVMTASEVSGLLQLPVSTVYYLARRGDLPATGLGAWRFLRPRLEELLRD
jgi:hypothetical protein